MAKRKGTLGGRRPGAGRPIEVPDRVRVMVDLEGKQLEALRAMAAESEISVSEMVRRLVAARMKRRGRRG